MTTETPMRRAGSLPMTDRRRALALLRAENEAWNALLATLDGDDWNAPTVCDRWTVQDIVGHLCGHAEEVHQPWLFPLRTYLGKRHHPDLAGLDAHMEAQVDAHRELTPAEVRERYATVWPRAVRVLGRLPTFVRNRSVATDMPGMPRIRFDYLHDVVFTRDNWMHRDDVCRALGREFAAHPHDGEVVAQVMRDLDRDFWDAPAVAIELTGIAPGVWQIGAGTPDTTVRADALEFMRLLAGRDRSSMPVVTLVTGDQAVADRVSEARVPF